MRRHCYRAFRWQLFSLLIVSPVSLPAVHSQPAPHGSGPWRSPQAVAASADEEEVFDQQLRELGYGLGLALSCLEKTKQKEGELRVLGMYNRVAQLFGTDRAFFFASAVGYGASAPVDRARCPQVLKTLAQPPLLNGSAPQGR